MNSLDLTLLIIMVISIVLGAYKGVVRLIFSLVAVIAGFVIASNYYVLASEHFVRLTSYKIVNDSISWLGIFVFSAILISFIGGRISGMVKKSKIKTLDLLLGSTIGVVLGLTICSLIIYALLVFVPSKSDIIRKSMALPYMTRLSGAVSPFAPRFFEEEFNKKVKELRSVPDELADKAKSLATEKLIPAETTKKAGDNNSEKKTPSHKK